MRTTTMMVTCVWLLGCAGQAADGGGSGDLDLGKGDDPNQEGAPAEAGACDGVTTIERPVDPGDAYSETFPYAFQVHPGTDPGAPAIVAIPGGPGSGAITSERDDKFPARFTVVQIDPRGVGCNKPATVDTWPDDFYRTDNFAGDILAVVEDLGLGHDWMLYGISYGTLLGTETASRAEAAGIGPRAVVLEGVLGRHFYAGEEEAQYHLEWHAIRDRLPDDIRQAIMSDPPPLGLSAEEWGGGIVTALSVAKLKPGRPLLENMLLLLGDGHTDAERDAVKQTIVSFGASHMDDFAWRLHVQVACHEITEINFKNLALRGGELVPTESYCQDLPVDRPFYASDYPVQAPMYFFEGTNDPNTPMWQAKESFAAHPGTLRRFVSIEGGGHNAFSINLEDCQPAVWDAIASGDGFAQAMATCTWPTALTEAPPDL